MIIQDSTVNIVFPRIENIKKQYIMNEELLKDKFNEANILPIPDEAPMEIPRIIMTSHQEHSQLNIAPETINLKTTYTDEYVENWSLCSEYIESRIEDVYKLTDKLTGEKYNYTGIVTNLIWNDVTENGNSILYGNIFKKEMPKNLDDIVIKFTFVEQNKYYVNITVQSVKFFEGADGLKAGQYSDENLKIHTISVMLDINDRYSFNNDKNYVSGKENFKDLMTLTEKVINEKIKNLITKGVY